MTSFADYRHRASQYVTFIDSAFYPDYLDEARTIYGSVIEQFIELASVADSSSDLLISITEKPNPSRTQLLRVFRKYVSPDTSVEMLKVKRRILSIVKDYGHRFRPLEKVRENLSSRPNPDEALMAILMEYKSRGQKGYELTEAFFLWFEKSFGSEFLIQGPVRAGRDVMLDEVLRDWEVFLNDGPGLTLGSMWNDYAALEDYGRGRVIVCTLKMLDERFTKDWLES